MHLIDLPRVGFSGLDYLLDPSGLVDLYYRCRGAAIWQPTTVRPRRNIFPEEEAYRGFITHHFSPDQITVWQKYLVVLTAGIFGHDPDEKWGECCKATQDLLDAHPELLFTLRPNQNPGRPTFWYDSDFNGFRTTRPFYVPNPLIPNHFLFDNVVDVPSEEEAELVDLTQPPPGPLVIDEPLVVDVPDSPTDSDKTITPPHNFSPITPPPAFDDDLLVSDAGDSDQPIPTDEESELLKSGESMETN